MSREMEHTAWMELADKVGNKTAAKLISLERFKHGVTYALSVYEDTQDATRLIARLKVLAAEVELTKGD